MLFVLSALPISRQDLFMTFTFLSVYFPYHKLEWSKVKGADGYQVYASDSQNGTYTRIKITKGTGATDESLLTGKTRYYKVRAYRKVNGKAVYGSFSKIKKVTVK